MADIVQLRGGTAAAWTAANTILADREVGVETDTGKIKLGNGATAWNSMAYLNTGVIADHPMGFNYVFDTSTAGTPANGHIQLNNATIGSATTLYMAETDANTVLWDALIDTMQPGTWIMIYSRTNSASYHLFKVSSAFTSGAGIDTVPVTWIAGNGTWSNGESIGLTLECQALPAATVTTQAYGDAGTVGTAQTFAREDHKHVMPASTKDTTAVTGYLQGNGTTVSAAATTGATSLVVRDANQNITINNVNESFQTIATAAGTTTLTVASPFITTFTGSSTQTLVLPAATTLAVGASYAIYNNSTGAVTVQTNGAATLWTMAGGTILDVVCTSNGTAAGTWNTDYSSDGVATAKKLTVSNSLTLAGTDATTMTFPTTSKTIAANDGSNLTISGQAIGDIPVASSTTAYGKLAAVATGSVLASAGTGTAPTWSASPALTSPTVTTQAIGDNSTKVASTGFVALADKVGSAAMTAATAGLNTTETILVKTAALAASRLAAGTTLRFTMTGTCTASVANTSTFTIRIGTNGTTADTSILALTTAASATSGTTIPFKATIDFTMRTSGASATSYGALELINNGTTGIATTATQIVVGSGTTFSTSTSNLIVSCSYKSAATTTTSTFQLATLEMVVL